MLLESKYFSMPYIKNSSAFIYALMLKGLPRVPMSFFIASKAISFSLASCLAPLIGFFSGVSSAAIVYVTRTIYAVLVTQSIGSCLLHLPTLSGTLYLTTESRLAKALIPLTCILLFLVHPIGWSAWAYTLYWIPPFVLSFVPIRSIFLRSLACTLATHAVGSTVWLYTHQTTALYWHSLIGIVWIERLMSALLLTTGYYTVVGIIRLVHIFQEIGHSGHAHTSRPQPVSFLRNHALPALILQPKGGV